MQPFTQPLLATFSVMPAADDGEDKGQHLRQSCMPKALLEQEKEKSLSLGVITGATRPGSSAGLLLPWDSKQNE